MSQVHSHLHGRGGGAGPANVHEHACEVCVCASARDFPLFRLCERVRDGFHRAGDDAGGTLPCADGHVRVFR